MNRAEKIAALKHLLAGRGNINELRRGLVDLSRATPEEREQLMGISHRNRELFTRGTPVNISELPDKDARFIYSIHTRNK